MPESAPAAVFLHFSGKLVGDDAHIVPADETILTKIFGEFEIAQWVDVGIDPYAFGKFLAAPVLDSRRITRQIHNLPLLCKLPEHRKRPASCLVVEIHERVVEQQKRLLLPE